MLNEVPKIIIASPLSSERKVGLLRTTHAIWKSWDTHLSRPTLEFWVFNAELYHQNSSQIEKFYMKHTEERHHTYLRYAILLQSFQLDHTI